MEPPRRFSASAGRYAGRRALITGAAAGIGYATAERLAAEGASVGLVDLNADAVEAAAERLRARGFDALGYPADATDESVIREVVSDYAVADDVRAKPAIDVLVTAAGVYPWVDFPDMTLDVWRQVVDINLTGTFICTHAVMPFMKEQKYGRIVTISSGTVLIGLPGQSAYIASKAGVIGLTRVLAREGGPFGVTANSVLPGLIATENVLSMRDDVDEFFASIVAGQCIQRRGEPGDIAEAIAWLGSEGSEFLTGQSLSIGGGDRFL